MTNQNIPADLHPDDVALARDFVDEYRDSEYATGRTLAVVRVLHALLPTPPRPTLADMTEEERLACQWMQCEVTNSRGKWILATPSDEDGDAGLVSSYGDICWLLPGRVTPRPDLPRLEWPGTEKPAPAPAHALPEGWRLADHEDHGRVIVTNPTPNLSGQVYFVLPSDTVYMGYYWHFCTPDELTFLDQEADQ